jgi:outer membrane biosynthesis protein TonB
MNSQSLPPRGLQDSQTPGARRWLSTFALVFSFGLHGVGWQLLPGPASRLPRLPPMTVELAPPPPTPPVPPPAPPPKPPAPPPEAAPPTPRKVVHPTPDPVTPPPPIDMAHVSPGPVALAGVVLSNLGSVQPLSRPAVATHPAAAPHASKPVPKVQTWVPVANLSQKPRPPALDRALRNHYPSEHKRSGTPGEASVELTLSEAGTVESAAVTRESAPGFGEACRLTLLPSRWSAPLDQAGRAVKTRVTYRCKFTVGS